MILTLCLVSIYWLPVPFAFSLFREIFVPDLSLKVKAIIAIPGHLFN